MGIEERLGDMKHFDDYYKAIKKEKRETDAKKGLDNVSKFEDNVSDFYTAVIKPAHDEFSKVLDSKLKGMKGDTKGKEKELKKVFIEALKAFFKKAMPSVMDGVKDIKDDDQLYRALAHKYDSLMMGYGNVHQTPILQGIAEGYSAKSGISVSKLRQEMDQRIGDFKAQNLSYLVEHYRKISLDHHTPEDINAVVKKEADKKGWKIEDHGQWHSHTAREHYQAYKGLTKGDWGINPETKQPFKPKDNYGLVQKK